MKKNGFTKAELIIVIVIVAILAATLIPTFVSLVKNKNAQEETNQQLADLAAKVESQQTLSAAEIESMIAASLSEIKIPEGVSSDDVSKAIADALKGITTGLTEAQVKTIVDSAVKNISTGLSAAEVEKIVNDAISKIVIPEAGVSVADIQKIVDEAVKNAGSVTSADVKKIVNEAVSKIEKGLTAAEVQKIVDAAVAKIEKGLTAAEVEKIINDAIKNLKLPESVLSVAEIEKLIADAIKEVKPGVSEEALKAAIEAALADLDTKILTEAQIKELIDKAIADLKPEETTKPEDTTKPEASKAASIELNTTFLSIGVGASGSLNATVLDQNGSVMPNANVLWSSSNTMCAYVNGGLVYGIAGGTATITATVEGTNLSATCLVYVGGSVVPSTVNVVSVTLNQTTANLKIGDQLTLIATVLPVNASNKNVVWTSSNSAVAAVDQNGKVTAVAAGNAIITVTTIDGLKTATCTVTVTAPVVNVEDMLTAGEDVTLYTDYTLTGAEASTLGVSAGETVVMDLNGKTLTMSRDFYFINVFGELTIKNGNIVASNSGQLSAAVGGTITLDGVTIVKKDGFACAISNNGTTTITNCTFINESNYSDMITNGMEQDGVDYVGTMTIKNTVFKGTYKDNYSVIWSKCGNIELVNVTIDAIRPVEAAGGTPYYPIVMATSKGTIPGTVSGFATINGQQVNFN